MSTKKTNRQLAKEYLEKAKKDDAEKIQAFTDACFTDEVLNALEPYTKADFRRTGSKFSPKIKAYFESLRQKAVEEKLPQPEKKRTPQRTVGATPVIQDPVDLDSLFGEK